MMGAAYATKKELKGAVGKPLNFIETSAFGAEYRDNGTFAVVGDKSMTVAELIRELKKLPQELPVVRPDTDWGYITLRGRLEVVDCIESKDGAGWLDYYPEVSEETTFRAVIL